MFLYVTEVARKKTYAFYINLQRCFRGKQQLQFFKPISLTCPINIFLVFLYYKLNSVHNILVLHCIFLSLSIK